MIKTIPKIKIIGIGGAGSNIVSKITDNLKEVEVFLLDTNYKALSKFKQKNKIQIGKSGLGTGANPNKGKEVLKESLEDVKNIITGADLVFLVAGFGGGTGTGILPEVAKLSKEIGTLTISVITKPFYFEGKIKKEIATKGIKELEKITDSFLVIDNNKISKIAKNKLTFLEAFELVDDFVYKIIKEIVQLLTIPAFINLDFADLHTVLKSSGKAVVSIGIGKGENKIEEAINTALSYSLIEDDNILNANKFILNIVASLDISYQNIQSLVDNLKERLVYNENTQIIFGADIDKNLEDEIKLTIIATDFNEGTKIQKNLHKKIEQIDSDSNSYI